MLSSNQEQLDYSRSADLPIQHFQQRIFADNAPGQALTIGSTESASISFQLPNDVINLAKSSINFTLTPGATASHYNWLSTDGVSAFRSIKLRSQNSDGVLGECDNANLVQCMTHRMTTKMEDMPQKPLSPFQGTCRSNALPSANLREVAVVADEIAYQTPQYFAVSDATNSATPVLSFSIPFSQFKHSGLLSADKWIYPNQNLYLEVIFSKRDQWGHTSTTNAVAGTTSAIAQNLSVSSLQLFVAQMKNNSDMAEVRAQIMKQALSEEGLIIPVEMNKQIQNSFTSTNQNNTIRVDGSYGSHLKRIYYTLYSATRSGSTLYDHSRSASYGAVAKVSSFNTFLDSQVLQPFQINVSDGQDYQIQKQFLDKSCITSASSYDANWCWLEAFDNTKSTDIDPSRKSGLPLNRQYQYSFNATTSDNTFVHQVVAVFARDVKINANGIQVL